MTGGSRRAAPLMMVAVLVLVCSDGDAAAQSESPPLRDQRTKRQKYGRLRLGPIYLTPRLTVTAGVDNNVYNDEANVVGDSSLTASPALDAVVPVTRHARLRGSGGFAPYWF